MDDWDPNVKKSLGHSFNEWILEINRIAHQYCFEQIKIEELHPTFKEVYYDGDETPMGCIHAEQRRYL